MQTQHNKLRSVADILGLSASFICAIHCLLLPVVLIAGASLPIFALNHEEFHTLILWLVLPTAIVAFGLGCKTHKDWYVLLLGGIGAAGLVSSVTWMHELLHYLGEFGESIVTIFFSGFLIAAHIRNWRICRSKDCQHSESHS